jgi:hypothetical protein
MRLFLLSLSIMVCNTLNSQNSIKLNQIQDRIKLDGIIDSVWSYADSTNDFIQMSPDFGKPPTYKTTAKILSNNESLFCLFICEIPREKIQLEISPRDNVGGDAVYLFLDTFRDKTNCYQFDINPAGQIGDAILMDDGRNRDYSWDGVWYAASKVYDWGYIVEIEIPYKSIRYSKDIREWGIDFMRWTTSKVENVSWARYKREEDLRISRFNLLTGVKPGETGLAFEIFPVAMLRLEKERNSDDKLKPEVGLDLKWNPNPGIGVQLTANPDFAQIEADPFQVNLSKYEIYFNEKRPFFVEGNEIFKAAGQEMNSGFYRPLEFFYSRRVGKKMEDGSEIPILGGAKVYGKMDDWDYGTLISYTGSKDIIYNSEKYSEDNALFTAARFKKRVFENSSIGALYASKFSSTHNVSILDLDGAFRTGDFQLAFQLGKSFNNENNGLAISSGLRYQTKNMILASRFRWIQSNFSVDDIGFVPWKGTGEFVTFCGPIWLYDTGVLNSFFIAGGAIFYNEKIDNYTDHYPLLIINFNFRSNWGMEFDIVAGKAKEKGQIYTSQQYSASLWAYWAQNYNFNFNTNFNYDYNYNREYFGWMSNIYFTGKYIPSSRLGFQVDFNSWIEYKPDISIEDITYNIRPRIIYAFNKDIHFRLFVDNTILKSTGKLERVLIGSLFSYNFSPKSWIYLAYNDAFENIESATLTDYQSRSLVSTNKIFVFKVRYLYYF